MNNLIRVGAAFHPRYNLLQDKSNRGWKAAPTNNNIKKETIIEDEQKSPYDSHVFVCTNDRGGVRKSCADGNSQEIRARLKAEVNNRGWKGRVRVSQCGCMGLCAKGPNVMIYPQQSWFPAATEDDADDIVARLENMLD